MGHATKQLVTKAAKLASVSTAHLAKFPPKQSLFNPRGDIPKAAFSPEIWAAAQPPPPTALSAFSHRIGMGSILTSPDTILQACTHSSFVTLHRQQEPHEPTPATNGQLAAIGNSLMGLFATEYVNAAYPYLPTRVFKAAVAAYVGTPTCATVAQEMGATPLVRWQRSEDVSHTDALASIPRALTALIYQNRSLPSARQFVHSYFLGRQIDLRGMIKFSNPKKALLEMVKKLGRDRPVSRLLKETGRFSNSPVFVVGVFSGADELGQGFGSSLKMAEYRAAEDALHRVYLTRTPTSQLNLPTSTFPLGLGDVFKQGPEAEYTAPELVMSEVMYASSGKSFVPKGPNSS